MPAELEQIKSVQSLLAQSNILTTTKPRVITVGDVVIETASRQVTISGHLLELTSTEYNILEALLTKAGHVISKAELSEIALGRTLTAYDRSIDMHISNLRSKLGPLSQQNKLIKTVRGIGYQYSCVD